MIAWISTEVLDSIAAETTAAGDREVCGLLFGIDDHVTAHLPTRNVAADPRTRFEIDPATLIAAHRAERRGGLRVAGCYHSHPSGPPEPSRRDAEDAEPNGWLWLIVGRNGTRLWRAVPNGSARGRFDPVPFACVSASARPDGAL